MTKPDSNAELKRLVEERLLGESADNLLGIANVFGLDAESLEAASPLARVREIMDSIDLAQLADLLEISGAESSPAPGSAPPSRELPPPRSEEDILSSVAREEWDSAPPVSGRPGGTPQAGEGAGSWPAPDEPEATFADDVLPAPAEDSGGDRAGATGSSGGAAAKPKRTRGLGARLGMLDRLSAPSGDEPARGPEEPAAAGPSGPAASPPGADGLAAADWGHGPAPRDEQSPSPSTPPEDLAFPPAEELPTAEPEASQFSWETAEPETPASPEEPSAYPAEETPAAEPDAPRFSWETAEPETPASPEEPSTYPAAETSAAEPETPQFSWETAEPETPASPEEPSATPAEEPPAAEPETPQFSWESGEEQPLEASHHEEEVEPAGPAAAEEYTEDTFASMSAEEHGDAATGEAYTYETGPAAGGEQDAGPPPAETAEDMDALAAEMLASGELTAEELAQLRAEAGEVEEEKEAAPEDEIDVLQQLRSVRAGSVRTRDKEKKARKQREADERKAAELTPGQKQARFRLWLFRATLVVFIVLIGSGSEVVIDVPNKAIRLKMALEYQVGGDEPAVEVTPPPAGTGTTGEQPPGPAPENPPGGESSGGVVTVVPPPPRVVSPTEQTEAFVNEVLRDGDLQGTLQLASRALDVPVTELKKKIFERAGDAGDTYQRAVTLMRARELDGAEEELRSALSAGSGTPAEIHYQLGRVQRMQGRLSEAMSELRKAIELSPDLAEAHLEMARIHRNQGDLPGAEAACRTAIEKQRKLLTAYYELAEIQKARGRADEVVATFTQLLEQEPEHSYAHFSIGAARFREGNLEEAAARFEQAIKANKSWVYTDIGVAYNNLAACLAKLGRRQEALAAYQAAAEARPDDYLVHYNLALAYQRYELPRAAIDSYERAIDLMQLENRSGLGKLYSIALFNLGEAYARVHLFRQAAATFEEVIRIDPEMEAAPEKLEKALEAHRRSLEYRAYYGTAALTAKGEVEPQPELTP